MRILLYSTFRTGSNNFINWLSKELNYRSVLELEKINERFKDNYIVKRVPTQTEIELSMDFIFERDYINFDKIIILYRKDTLKQSESNTYAIKTNKWRHGDGLDAFYKLDYNFLNEHKNQIIISKINFDTINQHFESISVDCIKLIYEEIFFDESKQKEVEDYVGFVAKTKLVNPLQKLRLDNNSADIKRLPRNIK